ncbi:unnamed protein product [Closterium sp. NIES-53]
MHSFNSSTVLRSFCYCCCCRCYSCCYCAAAAATPAAAAAAAAAIPAAIAAAAATSSAAAATPAADATPPAAAAAPGAHPCPSASYVPLSSLQRLKVSGCPELKFLPEGLNQLPRLEEFTLDCKNLSFFDQGIWTSSLPSTPPPLSAPISLPRSLIAVSISSTLETAHYLPESFLSLNRLTNLKISGLQALTQLIAPPSSPPIPATPCVPHEPSRLPAPIGQARLELLSSHECPAMSLLPACLPELFNLEKLSIIFLPLLTHLPKNLGQLKLLKKSELCGLSPDYQPSRFHFLPLPPLLFEAQSPVWPAPRPVHSPAPPVPCQTFSKMVHWLTCTTQRLGQFVLSEGGGSGRVQAARGAATVSSGQAECD